MTGDELAEWLECHAVTYSELDQYLHVEPLSAIKWRFGREPMPPDLKESLDLLSLRFSSEYEEYLLGKN